MDCQRPHFLNNRTDGTQRIQLRLKSRNRHFRSPESLRHLQEKTKNNREGGILGHHGLQQIKRVQEERQQEIIKININLALDLIVSFISRNLNSIKRAPRRDYPHCRIPVL